MSSPNQTPPSEHSFFNDPVLDRIMGFTFTLASEVYVLRDRLSRLEAYLELNGALSPEGLESFVRSPEQSAAVAADRDAFVAALMENILGRQVSADGGAGV